METRNVKGGSRGERSGEALDLLAQVAVGLAAALGELANLAARQVGGCAGPAVAGLIDSADEAVLALRQRDGDAGGAQQLQVAVKAAHVEPQMARQPGARPGPVGEELKQAKQASEALRGDGGAHRRRWRR